MLEVLMARHDKAHHNHFQAAMSLLKENPEKDELVPFMELSSELCPLVYGSPIIMRQEDGLGDIWLNAYNNMFGGTKVWVKDLT